MTTQASSGVIGDASITTAKLVDSAVTLAKVAAGAFTADAAGRAKFATGFVDTTLMATGVASEMLIGSTTVSAGATLDITGFDSTKYRSYRIELERVFPASAAILWMRTSTDGGATFAASASDYAYSSFAMDGVIGGTGSASTAAAQILLSGRTCAAAADSGLNGEIFLLNPGVAQRCAIKWQGGFIDNASNFTSFTGTALRLASAKVDAVRIMAASGNITGTARLYGVRL